MAAFVPLGATPLPIPGAHTVHGASPRRLCARVRGDRWAFSDAPHVCADDSAECSALSRMVARGEVAPADAATAALCGVTFRQVEFVSAADGWRFSASPTARTRKAE